MKIHILANKATIYRQADKDAGKIVELFEGDEVEFIRVSKKAGKSWAEVQTNKGERGFLPGETHMCPVQRARLDAKTADIYATPSKQANKVATFEKGRIFTTYDAPKEGTTQWWHLKTNDGVEGYIPYETKMKFIPDNPKGVALRNMVYSALWVGFGLIAMFLPLSSGVDPLLVKGLGLAAAIFGIIRVIISAIQYRQAVA